MKEVKTKLQEKNPEHVDAFEKGAQAYAKKIVANFKNYEFVRDGFFWIRNILTLRDQYTGEQMNVDGMVALLNYRVSAMSASLNT